MRALISAQPKRRIGIVAVAFAFAVLGWLTAQAAPLKTLHGARERAQCVAVGGRVVWPDSGVAACQTTSSNAGRVCRDAAQCDGSSCLAVRGAASQAAGRSLGRCSEVALCGGMFVVDGDVVSHACELH